MWYGLYMSCQGTSPDRCTERKPRAHRPHTTPSAPAHIAEPPFIRRLLIALTLAVLLVAVVSNGAAYLGGVAFAQNVMRLTPITAYVFGGVIELALAVVAGATFIEAYRLQPTAVFRTATWALSGASGLFGALFEVMEYLTGALSLSAAAWLLVAHVRAVPRRRLWELVIHLFCGNRHRAHRAQERRHALLYGFFKAGEAEGLAHGTWRAPAAAARARAAARRIAKHVPRDERDAQLGAWLASAQYGEHVRVWSQRLQPALHTACKRPDCTCSAACTCTCTCTCSRAACSCSRAGVATADLQPETAPDVQNYGDPVAAAVQREERAILAAVPTAEVQTHEPAPPSAATSSARSCRRTRMTRNAVHRALVSAGHRISLRTAYNDRDVVMAGM